MEEWQMTHIRKNLPNLLIWTNCNTRFLAILQAENVLADADVEAIKCKKQPNCKADLLYNVLKTRNNAYYVLVKALIETKQTGAAKLLLEIPTEKICKLRVSLLETVSSLETLLNPDQIQSIQSSLSRNASVEELFDIHKEILSQDVSVQLLRDTIPPPNPLYISRLLMQRVVVNPKLFEEKCPDVFVFKDTERATLRKFVTSHAIEYSTDHLLRQTCTARFILLDVEDDWEKVRSKVTSPAHLIRYEVVTNIFLLEETTGNSNILSQYLNHRGKSDNSNDSQDNARHPDAFASDFGYDDTSERSSDEVSEDETKNSEDGFLKAIMAKNIKSICICDSPVMGKSLLLANLARKIMDKYPDRIVAFIQLRNFMLPNDHMNLCPQTLLFEQLATSALARVILFELVNCKNIKLELFFDGLDEVQDSHFEPIIAFFPKLAKSMAQARIFVTSRPVWRSLLEKTLGVIAYDISPFNKETQLKFLTAHWTQNEPSSDVARLTEYAKVCLESTHTVLKDREKHITGVPLQCKLIADVYSSKATIYADKKRQVTLPSSFATSLHEIYSIFMSRQLGHNNNCRYGCMLSINKTKCDQGCKVRSFHAWKALELIFPDFVNLMLKNAAKLDDVSQHKIFTLGILEKRQDIEKYTFSHRTFAEYLAAEFLYWNCFSKSTQNLPTTSLYTSIQQMAFNEIFTYNKKYKNNQADYTFREDVVAYFLNSMMAENKFNLELCPSTTIFVLNNTYFRKLLACIVSDYTELLQVFMKAASKCDLSSAEQNESSTRHSEHQENTNNKNFNQLKHWVNDGKMDEELKLSKGIAKAILENAVRYCCVKTVDTIYDFFLNTLNIDLNVLVWPPPIDEAISRADYEMVNYFSAKMPLDNLGLLYKCVEYSYRQTEKSLDKTLEIAELLLTRSPQLLTETWNDQGFVYKSPILAKYVHLKIIKLLVKKGCDFQLCDAKGDTLLRHAAWYMSDEDFFKLCQFLYNQNQDYFMDPANWTTYVGEWECWYRYRTKTLLKILNHLKIEKLFVENITAFRERNVYEQYKKVFNSLLHSAFTEGNDEFVDLIVSNDSSLLDIECYNGGSVIHYAAVNQDLAMMNYFANKGTNIFAVDSSGRTVLHLAAQTGNSEFFHEVVCFIGDKWKQFRRSGCLPPEAANKEMSFQRVFNRQTYDDLKTSLHCAVRYLKDLRLETLDLLLQGGANLHVDGQTFAFNINAIDIEGESALYTEVKWGQRLDVVKHLIRNKADWKVRNRYGRNIAQFCAQKGLVDFLKYFVGLGINVNQLDKWGNNALQCAMDYYSPTSNCLTEIIQFLLSAGAKKEHKNWYGRTAYDIAFERSQPLAVLCLLELPKKNTC